MLAMAMIAAALVAPRGSATASTGTVANDTFSRDVVGSWGAASVGGKYSVRGGSSSFQVGSSHGSIELRSPGTVYAALLTQVDVADVDVSFRFAMDKLVNGGEAIVSATARHSGPGYEYRARMHVSPSGALTAQISRAVGGQLTDLTAPVSVPGGAITPGTYVWVRVRVVGSAPTALHLRVWRGGTTEPTTWLINATDNSSALTAAGSVGVRAYTPSSATNLPVTVNFDDIAAVAVTSNNPHATPTPTPDATATPTPRPTATPAPAHAVALGAYIPGAPMDPSKIDAYATLTGTMPHIVMWYQEWSGQWNYFYAKGADAVRARGATPYITWEAQAGNKVDPNWTLDSITNGSHDAYIRQWTHDVAAWGKPIFVRPLHEMNGNWYPWGMNVNGNSTSDFVPAWRHIVNVANSQGATNISWVWCPNVASSSGQAAYAALYPGDAYVNWSCIDGYNWGTSQSWSHWQSLSTIFNSSIDAVTALTNKPLMIGEMSSAESGGDKASWITNGYASLLSDMPAVRAVTWFDTVKETDWRVNSSTDALSAYRAVSKLSAFSATAP
jgi:hypothetical protein